MDRSVVAGVIEQKILFVRGKKVMLDKDLARLYGIETRDLNKAVMRNSERFPEDFMFMVSQKEFENLMFQYGTSRWGGTRKLPKVFTEQGIAMLSSVLRSDRAIQVNIAIIRAFVRMREILATHKELALRLDKLEQRMDKKDQESIAVFEAIRKLMAPPPDPIKHKIGF